MITILTGGTIITMDADRNILEQGDIAWKDDRILWLRKTKEVPDYPPDSQVIPIKGKVVIPGLINTHTHAALSLLRGIADDRGIAPAYSPKLPQGSLLSPQDCYIFSLLGGLEALRFGTTCIVDNYIHEDSAAQAFAELGLRAVVSERLHDADLTLIPKGVYKFDKKLGEDLLTKNLDLIEKWEGACMGRISCRMGPHAPDTCSQEYLKRVYKAAQAKNVGLVIHLSQSKNEVKEILKRTSLSPTEYLESVGMLGKQTIAGHCIYVTEDDINILAMSGTQVSHLSESNAKEGKMAPIKSLKERGVNVALGTDNMSGDMVGAMHMALCVARMRQHDPQTIHAIDVLEMSTRNGALALGMQMDIGTLETGKKADLVVFDFQKPHLTPVIDPVANLVCNGTGGDVDTVVVDGHIVFMDGNVTTIDQESLLKEAQQIAKSLWEKV